MKVLSLFDGMSCGQIALLLLGIIPEAYYASETDKHAIKQTQINFPDTVQLGDVTKWKEWDIDWKSINLLLAGSPCQGFSFAGKQLAFDDQRSKLFFVFIDILNHIKSVNPDVLFLLENVNMKRSHMRIISEYCGVFPVNINSNLVSAQNRDRWYWTNIRTKQVGLFGEVYVDIPQPKDRGILIRNILEDEVVEKYFLSAKIIAGFEKHAERHKEKGTGFGWKPTVGDKKANCLRANPSICPTDNIIIQRPRGNNKGGLFDGKAPTLSSFAWEQNNLLCTKDAIVVHNMMPRSSKNGNGGTGHLTRSDGKTYCLDTGQTNAVEYQSRIRRLTPTECSRLQTVPAWYRWECSDTQVYKMLGNGWTVEVIKHILGYVRQRSN